MDPLSIASGVAGLISLAFELSKAVSGLISDIKDAPTDIQDLDSDVKSLSALLGTTQALYDTYGQDLFDDSKSSLGETFDVCLRRCLGPLQELQGVLASFSTKMQGKSMKNPMRMMSWVMKKGEVNTLKDRLKDAKASLTLTISVLNGYVCLFKCVWPFPFRSIPSDRFISGKGQEQIQHDINQGYEKLRRDFMTAESGKKITQRLTLDVTSEGPPAYILKQPDSGRDPL
jgi:hypothetical protein